VESAKETALCKRLVETKPATLAASAAFVSYLRGLFYVTNMCENEIQTAFETISDALSALASSARA
jgi:hypothetical protein